jgi:LCP family protein required for cell wall assembly
VAAPTGLRAPRRPLEGPGQRQRSRWRGRLLKGSIIFVAVCVLLSGFAYVYVRHQLGRINRIDIPGLAGDAGGVMNVLLVGSDSRERVEGDLADATGKGEEGTAGQRSDTMMVLHIDPKARKAAILSIPRDLYVPISGEGYSDKINAAFAVGGAPLLVRTIQESLGIDINHYVEVDFAGFERIVNTVGGVKVYFDAPARDENTGLDVPEAGCVQLDGYQALAFVRSRYYESYESGRWHAGSNNDLDRIARQQDFIRRMMKKAVSQGLTNPLTLNRLIGIGVDNVTLDKSMSTKDIATVARRFRSLDPDTVDMQTLPTTGATRGGASVVLLDEDAAQPFIERINGLAEPASARPAEVRVRVLNGNGADGAAGRAAFALQNAGFVTIGTGEADSFNYQRTMIYYAPGKQPKAELLQSYLQGGAGMEEDDTLGLADLTLVVGADYTGVRPGPGAPNPNGGPATTAAPQSPGPTPAEPSGPRQPAC